ncbi:hypothetical protein CH333_06235 [candidate division WOR-3 bacterium JGI_Cruoil_03_44_89]|uniref:V-ATPase subunit E n=1 Tax=candidate division WOR-3 bacterium JGI_Cruoil_03_44_89 TaxID=1973748 RepID=A0A235BRX1_UNCW3|nr:MAG: hypothetical protein CH333_06235 [candidate division WOR-3 bacterium JGI_Cruoil_03_44_89]
MNKVSKKILEDVEKEGNRIVEEAKEKKKEIEKATESEIKKLTEEIDLEVKETEEREYERLMGLKNIEQRNILLGYKHNLMNQLFEEIREEILKSNGYPKLIDSLFEVGVESGKEDVLVGKDEKIINKKFIDKLNKDKGWHLKLSKERVPIKGGFILRGEKTEIDASIETVLGEKREILEPELVDILFGERQGVR